MQLQFHHIVLFLLSSIMACKQADTHADMTKVISEKIESLKSTVGFDKRDDIFEYTFESGSDSKKIMLTIKTSENQLAEKVAKLANENGIEQVNIIHLPSEELTKTPYGVVSQSVANLRDGPSRAEPMATQALMGMRLEIFEKDGQWHHIKTPQGYIAWIPKPSFEYLTKAQADSLDKAPKMIVTTSTTFAYDPAKPQKVISDLVFGNVVKYIKKERNYTTIELPGHRIAIVKNDEVTPLKDWQKNAHFNPQELINFAYKFNGQPYLWGGNSFKGIDCSGFAGAVYQSTGLLLPRDASQQVTQGDPVPFSIEEKEVNGEKHKALNSEQLQVGDLLFFGNDAKTRVTHVAVWIGDHKIIHSSGRVHVSSLDPNHDNYEEGLVQSLMEIKRMNGSQNLDKTIDLTKTSIW